MKKTSKFLVVGLAISSALALTYAQVGSRGGVNLGAGGLGNSPEAQALVQVYQSIKDSYLKPTDDATLLRGAITGMLGSLDDKFTGYSTPEEAKSSNEQATGTFFGIGAQLEPVGADGTGVRIGQVYKGQPAARGGIQIGDVILKVNDDDVTKLTVSKARNKIVGANGTPVKLEVQRGSSTLEFNLVRSEIKTFAVESTVLPGNVGYIAINTFFHDLINEQVDAAINKLNAAGVKKAILDLRDNGGGYVCAGTYVADKFLAKSEIVTFRDRTGRERPAGRPGSSSCPATATPSSSDYSGELIVLINKNSASASEIVAGAVQDEGRGKIVGEKSYGKGVAQSVFTVEDGGEVRLVAQEWLTPKGRAIQDKGITPDVLVEDTRFGKTFNIEGLGAKPGEKLTLTRDGKPLTLTADKDGKFSYTDTPQRPPRGSDVQGEAYVDLKGDAEVVKALELLGVPQSAQK